MKSNSYEVSDGNKEYILETGIKAVLVTKWQVIWLNHVHVLGLYRR
jgi:hypothetical protein